MASGRMNQKDWYEVLGAKPSDSLAELKRKYQKLALLGCCPQFIRYNVQLLVPHPLEIYGSYITEWAPGS